MNDYKYLSFKGVTTIQMNHKTAMYKFSIDSKDFTTTTRTRINSRSFVCVNLNRSWRWMLILIDPGDGWYQVTRIILRDLEGQPSIWRLHRIYRSFIVMHTTQMKKTSLSNRIPNNGNRIFERQLSKLQNNLLTSKPDYPSSRKNSGLP